MLVLNGKNRPRKSSGTFGALQKFIFLLCLFCCFFSVEAKVGYRSPILSPREVCPPCPCFHCIGEGSKPCTHYGKCNETLGSCICPPGMAGPDCSVPTCQHGKANTQTHRCDCDAGWEGYYCQICSGNSTCASIPGGSNYSYCDKSAAPVFEKLYSCGVKEASLLQILGRPGIVNLQVFTPVNANITANFNFIVQETATEDRQDLFSCGLENCTDISTETDAKYFCPFINCTMDCQLGQGKCSAILAGVVGIISGDTTLTCANGHSNCIVDATALQSIAPTGLHLDCSIGECVNNPAPAKNHTRHDPRDKKRITFPVWIIVVTSGIFCVAIFGVIALVARKFYNDKRKTDGYAYFNDQDASAYLRNLCQPEGAVNLTFRDVSYNIGEKRKKQILRGVTGIAKSKELMAIMGPSGAGKSTFLDILGNRSKSGSVSGEILVNGRTRDRRFKRLIGFVDQEECLISTLSVRESLTFSAMLRLPDSVPTHVKHERVEEVMKDLKILSIADSAIGGVLQRGISGGEKRRVSIGMELVTCPSILFLDEPTSGLDSFNAHVIVRCLALLAENESTTIVMTIHQPRSNIFHLFDKLLLLTKGEVVYMGPSKECVPFFNSIGYHCPPAYNPADFLIDSIVEAQMRTETDSERQNRLLFEPEGDSLLDEIGSSQRQRRLSERSELDEGGAFSSNRTDVEEGKRMSEIKPSNDNNMHYLKSTDEDDLLLDEDGVARYNSREKDASAFCTYDLVNSYIHSDIYNDIFDEIQAIRMEEAQQTPGKGRTGARFTTQLLLLCQRTMLNLVRNPYLFWGHLVSAAFVGVILGTLYFDINGRVIDSGGNQEGLISQFEQRLGVLLLMCAFLAFGSLSSLELFHSERVLYVHERANRFYYPSTYYISKLLFDFIPLRILPPVVMGCIAYSMIGLRQGVDHLLHFLIILILVNLVAASVCMLIGILIPRLATANLLASLFMLLSLMLTNIFNNPKNMPKSVGWVHYCSFFNYGYEALALNELEGVYIKGEILGAKDLEVSGTLIIQQLGLDPNNFVMDICLLAVLVVVLQITAYVCLKFFVKQKR